MPIRVTARDGLVFFSFFALLLSHCGTKQQALKPTTAGHGGHSPSPTFVDKKAPRTKTETETVSTEELRKLRADFEIKEHWDTFTPRSPDFFKAESAAAKLVAMGSAGVPVLLDAVDSGLHWSIACRYLWNIHDYRIVPFLNDQLKKNPSTEKEMWIRAALMRLSDHYEEHYRRFEALLLQSAWDAEQDRNMTLGFSNLTYLRMDLVQILGYVGTDDTVALILKVFDRDKGFVWSVILALENSGNPKAVPTLINLWNSRADIKVHPDEQYMPNRIGDDILSAMAHCGGDKAFRLLMNVALHDSDEQMRNAAVSAIAYSPLLESEHYVTTLLNNGLYNFYLCDRICERHSLNYFVYHAECEKQGIYTCRKAEFLNSEEGRALLLRDLRSGSAAQKWAVTKALAKAQDPEALRFLDENLGAKDKEAFLSLIALKDNFTVDALNRTASSLPSYDDSIQRVLFDEILWVMDHQADEAGLRDVQTEEWIPTEPLINIIRHAIDSEDDTTARLAMDRLDRLIDRGEASNIAQDEEFLTLIYELATAKRPGAGDCFRLMILYLLLDRNPNSTRRSFVRDLYIEFIKDDTKLALPSDLFLLSREDQIALLSAGLQYVKKGDWYLSKIASALAIVDPKGSRKKLEKAYRETRDPNLSFALFRVSAKVPIVEEYKNAKSLENESLLQFDWIHDPRMIPVFERTAKQQKMSKQAPVTSYSVTIRVLKRARVFAKKDRVSVLIEALKDEDLEYVHWATLELGLMGDRRALPALRELSGEGKKRISTTAAIAAEYLNSPTGDSPCFHATLFEAVTYFSGMSDSVCNFIEDVPR
jgi:HEAT repeat protein